MTVLREYVEHWFRHTAMRVGKPEWLERNAVWVQQAAEGRPGFADELRNIALEALQNSERELVHRALAALAVIGSSEDLGAIGQFTTSHDEWLAAAARTAAFEIEHRAA